MKNFKNVFAILVVAIALYSFNSFVSIDSPQTLASVDVALDGPGNQINDAVDVRDNDEE